MCACNPTVKTPWCGKPGCEMPVQSGEQPRPVRNDRPAVQDLVIEDVRTISSCPIDVREKIIREIERRKAIGLQRYGTLLQPFNGRDCVRDAREEALDLVQYLRQGVEEGIIKTAIYYRALDLLEEFYDDPNYPIE